MAVLWLLYALVRPTELKSKDATKDMRLGLSDEEVSSEEGASDLATGDLVCSTVFRDPALGWAAGGSSASLITVATSSALECCQDAVHDLFMSSCCVGVVSCKMPLPDRGPGQPE